MKKFWFVAYAYRRYTLQSEWEYENTITEVHPLQWWDEEHDGETKLCLLFWKELDEGLGDKYWEKFQ